MNRYLLAVVAAVALFPVTEASAQHPRHHQRGVWTGSGYGAFMPYSSFTVYGNGISTTYGTSPYGTFNSMSVYGNGFGSTYGSFQPFGAFQPYGYSSFQPYGGYGYGDYGAGY